MRVYDIGTRSPEAIQALRKHKQDLVEGMLRYASPTFNDKGVVARQTLKKVGILYG